MASQDRADIYARITAEIVAAIEAGTDDYCMPWHHDGAATARPVNVASGKTYRGVNVLALWVAAHSAGYPTGLWGTYRQWHELGAQVRNGERSTTVVFWKQIGLVKSEDEQDGGDEDRRRFLARGYPAFNRPRRGVLYEPRDHHGLRRRPGLLFSIGGQGAYARVWRFQGCGGTLQRPVS